MASRSWSARARRDFREREEYRKERGEEDRYKKRDSGNDYEDRDDVRRGDGGEVPERSEEDVERDAREDRREERGYEYDDERLPRDVREAMLMDLRNASPDDDVDDRIDRLRREFDYYEQELDRYDSDYDRALAQLDAMRRENRRYMMRDSGREEQKEEIKDFLEADIRDDQEYQSYKDAWKERIG